MSGHKLLSPALAEAFSQGWGGKKAPLLGHALLEPFQPAAHLAHQSIEPSSLSEASFKTCEAASE